MAKNFQKKVENFVCQHCGQMVQGNGYTNHCPYCLWSKHVDVNPGDRQAECGGLMEPIIIEQLGQNYIIVHRCQACGAVKKNKVATNDSFDQIIKISNSF